MAGDVRAFFEALGIELPGWAHTEAPVRCFADPGAHQREDRDASCSVNVAPCADTGTRVRKLIGTAGSAAAPDATAFRSTSAAESPGDVGIEKAAVSFALAPGASVRWAGDTVPTLVIRSARQLNWIGPE